MKSILLPLTSQSTARNVLDVAVDIAKASSASLTGLFISPDPRTTIPFMGEGLTADMIQDLCNAATAESEAQETNTLDLFETALARRGVKLTDDIVRDPESCQARWLVCSGLISDHVGRRGRTADVAVCAKPSIESADSQEVFHDLIYRSGRPVLMIPPETTSTPGKHIMVAWNGRAEGARAVGAALPLLKTADTITLLQIGEPQGDRPGVEHAADYLRDHGLSSIILNPMPEGGAIGEQILSIANKERADMVVVGAYSHSRWREMILGGVTRHLVNHSNLPIFMSH